MLVNESDIEMFEISLWGMMNLDVEADANLGELKIGTQPSDKIWAGLADKATH